MGACCEAWNHSERGTRGSCTLLILLGHRDWGLETRRSGGGVHELSFVQVRSEFFQELLSVLSSGSVRKYPKLVTPVSNSEQLLGVCGVECLSLTQSYK